MCPYPLGLEPVSGWPLSFDAPSSPNLTYISITTSMHRELANHCNACLPSQTILLSGLW